LARLLLFLLHIDRFVVSPASGPFAPLRAGTRNCPQFNSCTLINLWLRYSLYRDTALTYKTCTLKAKSAPPLSLRYIGAGSPSLHRDSFSAKVPGPDSYRDCPDAASSNTTSLYCCPLAFSKK